MSEIQAKQQFLRVEILEAGIDPGEFLAFLVGANSRKGDNLELWNIQQLQEVVKAFKRSKNIPLKSDQIAISILSQEKAKQTNAYYDDSLYVQTIACIQKQPNKISTYPDMKIRITKFEKIEGGAFERSYIIFKIEIPMLDSCVGRRYSDFVWLRDCLITLYPGYPIPPLKKKGNFKRYDDKYLIKKMLILQKFLNTLIAIPEFYSQPLFERFLTVPNPKQFEKLKNQSSKLQRQPLGKLRTLNGFVTIGTEAKLSNKVNKYQDYLRQTQPEIKKIYKNFKGVATCFEQANQIFQSISTGCKFLQGKEQAIRAQLELPSIVGDSPLSILENLTREYGVQLQEQAQSFRKDIYSLMKYQSLSRINVLEFMDQLKEKQEEYNQARANLLKKKDKLYAEGRMDKWGLQVKLTTKPPREEAIKIMLPKETKQLTLLRLDYALYNCQIYEECFRHTKDINRMLSNYIRQFVEMQVTNAAKTAEIFTQISRRTLEIQKLFHISSSP